MNKAATSFFIIYNIISIAATTSVDPITCWLMKFIFLVFIFPSHYQYHKIIIETIISVAILLFALDIAGVRK